jgi:hypothetical protein
MEGSPLNLLAGNMTIFSLTLFGGIDLTVEAVLVQSCRADAECGGDAAYVAATSNWSSITSFRYIARCVFALCAKLPVRSGLGFCRAAPLEHRPNRSRSGLIGNEKVGYNPATVSIATAAGNFRREGSV